MGRKELCCVCDGVLCVVVCGCAWWRAHLSLLCYVLVFKLVMSLFFLTLISGRSEFGVGERSKKNEINGTNRTHKKHIS